MGWEKCQKFHFMPVWGIKFAERERERERERGNRFPDLLIHC